MRAQFPLGLSLILMAGCGAPPAVKVDTSALDACQSENVSLRGAAENAGDEARAEAAARRLADARMAAYRDIAAKLRAAFPGRDLDIVVRRGRLVLRLPNAILFDLGQAELKPEGTEMLTKVAKVLAKVQKRRFLVAGHTDSTPVKKTAKFADNWELSTMRALVGLRVLVQHGAPKDRIAAAGYGAFSPDAPNTTPENQQKNRRTEIVFMPTIDEIPEMPEKFAARP